MSEQSTVPPFHGDISFNAHHSPMGAYFTFTCGHFGSRGGLAVEAGRPANQDIYIGVKDGDRHAKSPLRCLPFYKGAGEDGAQPELPEAAQQAMTATAEQAGADADRYLVEQAEKDDDLADPDADIKQSKVVAYGKDQITRHYGWASDRWQTPDFSFAIHSPFFSIPDPATSSALPMQLALLPAITAELTIDNRRSETTRTAVFALNLNQPGGRMLDEGIGAGRVGFAVRRHLGVAAELHVPEGEHDCGIEPFGICRWTPDAALLDADNPVHLLGSCPGVGVEVPPGHIITLRLALGAYQEGFVTTRLDMKYLYTNYYSSLQHVLGEALESFDVYKRWTEGRDETLVRSGLNADQQFLIAHSTHSYYGSTQLLDLGGRPYWVVNEGEYCMVNTLDLSIDHVFWELEHNPWVVRNLLDNFVRYYSYVDQVKDPDSGQMHRGGISFCHDQGVNNQFSPIGCSSYELTNLPGCFSHMTFEQLTNWTIMAGCYIARTGDVEWARQQSATIRACLASMLQRDHPDPAQRNGMMGFDSSRCGQKGQEITTYDSLDASLGQARNNLYLGVKGWAAYEALSFLLMNLEARDEALEADAGARRAARTIANHVNSDGYIPAVFEQDNPGWTSKILSAIEGLVYPMYWAACHEGWGEHLNKQVLNFETDNEHAAMLRALKTHTQTLLRGAQGFDGANRFPDGGIKLSSSANNSWMSKIAIFQYVARALLQVGETGNDLAADAAAAGHGFEQADAAHVSWQTTGDSAYWAMSDQMVKGVAFGSKYYPRCVTTCLWLSGPTET